MTTDEIYEQLRQFDCKSDGAVQQLIDLMKLMLEEMVRMDRAIRDLNKERAKL